MRPKAITIGDMTGPPGGESAKLSSARAIAEPQVRTIRRLIWLYIFLWLMEGALRRWFLPGLASPLLLIRDPVVFAIYGLAMSNGLFPGSAFVTWGFLLGLLTFLNAMVLGHGNAFVALYGVRCDVFHVPLIFIMGRVLKEKDIIGLAKVAVWLAVPYTALLVTQFYEPQSAWVNRGVGGNLEGAGFAGALDRFRPPGTFSFITGPAQLYPLITACWFLLLLIRKLPIWTMALSGGAILVAVPISISRTLFLSVAIVAAAGMIALLIRGRLSGKLVLQIALFVLIVSKFASNSTVFHDGLEAFNARWEGSTTEGGGFQVAIVDRVLNDLFGSFAGVKSSGLGTGFSTNVGQKSLTAAVGFGASEAEWGRLLYDNGFILGTLLIAYRLALAVYILRVSWRAWKRGSALSLLFAAACIIVVPNGQWGQPTTLGSAIIGGGLALAAASDFAAADPKLLMKQAAEQQRLSRWRPRPIS